MGNSTKAELYTYRQTDFLPSIPRSISIQQLNSSAAGLLRGSSDSLAQQTPESRGIKQRFGSVFGKKSIPQMISVDSFDVKSDHSEEGEMSKAMEELKIGLGEIKALIVRYAEHQDQSMQGAKAHREKIRLDMMGSPLRRESTARVR